MTTQELPDHVQRNRAAWDEWAADYVASGGLHRLEWKSDRSVNFALGYGDWIRLLRENAFEVEDLIELRPAEDAKSNYPWVTVDWARNWPSEEVWKARKHG